MERFALKLLGRKDGIGRGLAGSSSEGEDSSRLSVRRMEK